jgi:hypothetical protein
MTGVARFRERAPSHVRQRRVAGAIGRQRVTAVGRLERGRPVVPPRVDADVAPHFARVDVEAGIVLPPGDRERLEPRPRVDPLNAGV